MRRTKSWWGRLTKEERSELWWLEKGNRHIGISGGMLPDDCCECGCCGNPMLSFGGGLCKQCDNALDYLLAKANGAVS